METPIIPMTKKNMVNDNCVAFLFHTSDNFTKARPIKKNKMEDKIKVTK
jgi:hypothetical protein